MQISKVFLIVSLAATAALQLQAQPASPESQAKALELLRQAITQDQQHGAEVMTVPGKVAAGDQQDQALKLLRQKIAEDSSTSARPSSDLATATVKQSKSASAKKPQAPTKSTGAGPAAPESVQATNPNPGAVAPSSGPRTKQERLADLFEQYKADKISPAQYHAERAKIIAEP